MQDTVKIPDTDWVYDVETYDDLFSAGFTHAKTGTRFIFEVSARVNQSHHFIAFLEWIKSMGHRLAGFNNIGFDWPICDHLLRIYRNIKYFTCEDARAKCCAIFASTNRFEHLVKPWEIMVTQLDLFKLHHFDNMARSTSLKKLEINMRARKVVDLPYPPDEPTTSEQKDEIIAYMCHDINETMRFYLYSLDQINFRDDLAAKYPDLGDVLNFNDTKIGKQFFIMKLEEAGTQCFTYRPKKPIQTIRGQIVIADILSDKAVFKHPEFIKVKSWLETQTITPEQTKGFLGGDDGGLSATVDGFQYDFGTGGIHGSMHRTAVHEDDEWEIWDWDVASYYPNLAITHGLFPEHLSKKFCDIYLELYNTRKEYPKGTAENAMYKLALNGVYGDSNNVYSPFYDPQYTMSITINGQLLLCVLAEWLTHLYKDDGSLVSIADCIQLMQINTDGLTIKVRKTHVEFMHNVCKAWEQHTGLELESVRYKSMFIRDVNNYMAVKHGGGVKRIGAYSYETPLDNPYTRERQWHQDHSMLVIRKAAEAYMIHGTPVAEFIMAHRDPFDFQLSVKVARKDVLEQWTPTFDAEGNYERDEDDNIVYDRDEIQRNTRYYVSTDGPQLTKVLPPLAKQFYGDKALISRQDYDLLRANAERDMADNHDVRSSASISEWMKWRNTMERKIGVQKGWTVTITNDMDHFRWDNVNWYFYIEEANKLIIGD